jgi:hypothetical protein
MTRSGLARGSAIFATMVVAGFFLGTYLDQRFTYDAADYADYHLTSGDRQEAAAPDKSRSACVGEDGSWKNWSSPNVPTLSPRCKRRR